MNIKDLENKIINNDCLNILKQLPDKCIDLVLTDPPYGINADKGTHGFGTAKNRNYFSEWDNQPPEKKYLMKF